MSEKTDPHPLLKSKIQTVEQESLADDPYEHKQVNVFGAWHRYALGGRNTACGCPVPGGADRRDGSYRRPLCTICHSGFELARSADGSR